MLSFGARHATYTSRLLAVSARRTFHSSQTTLRGTAKIPKPTKSTRTKKATSELPKIYVTVDGKAVDPLGEWHGGAKAKSPARKTRSCASSASKTKTKAKIAQEEAVTPESDDINDIEASVPKTPVAREVQENLKNYPNCLLLTRIGQFYESYFDPQASEIAALLGIKLTAKTWNGERVPFCGFPLQNLEKHLKTLVQEHGRFVAMCEEFSTISDTGVKTFERRVARIITPGTLIDEDFLDSYQNNYLLAVGADQLDGRVGLAWIDVSTGEYLTKSIASEELLDELTRISPREVVLDKKYDGQHNHPVLCAIREDEQLHTSFITPIQPDPITSPAPSKKGLKKRREAAVSSITPEEANASSILLTYLKGTLMEYMPNLYTPTQSTSQNRMRIDTYTMKALEIKERTREGGIRGSLLSVIKRTTTQGGSRLLARWLAEPSTSLEEINHRHSIVSVFSQYPYFSSDVRAMLRQLGDLERLIQSFILGRASATDLVALNKALRTAAAIEERIAQELVGLKKKQTLGLSQLIADLRDLTSLSACISGALDDVDAQLEAVEIDPEEADAKVDWSFGVDFLGIKATFSPQLTKLHTQLKDLHAKGHEMQARLQKTARATTKSYYHKDWTNLGSQIFTTRLQIKQLEREAFKKLREEVLQHSLDIRRSAAILHELDVLASFATLATELKFVRPSMRDDTTFYVVDGRHPTVELGLLSNGRTFQPNSIHMSESSNLHIITGPNMAGKSTVLRQTALIAILAQIGSFVPADMATIGIVDQVFSRVGAKDDLFHDRSTFMVEMLETAEILKRATAKSLVIMDEVGRGTTVHDGLAIAYATIHHLATVNKCRTLFATHFHELEDMIKDETKGHLFPTVDFYCTDIHETSPTQFTYSYHLRSGVNRDSHGLKVASLAGMPRSAMEVAEETLRELKAMKQ
ncbi:hypothetical protein BDN72DRAFT_16820 [Pluteus cervinus]|uniref:Uncharacterized protein n=1 Tax=Pluteus cervinus TaxID=181527 RepID=A0ACD3BFT0_9AGAR|nr:hypothetical protein BDN72DRAFT_16820 [Pluteus cervinus]